jgi:hypothetical protein
MTVSWKKEFHKMGDETGEFRNAQTVTKVMRDDMGKPTDEEIDKIEQLLLTRQYSGKAIADIMGRTRNSIVGIIWRTPRLHAIGLPGTVPAPLAKGAEKRYASAERRIRWAPQRVGDPPRPLTLVWLQKNQCRYPTSGEGENTLFCGQARDGESSYCPRHRQLCVASTRRLTVAQ